MKTPSVSAAPARRVATPAIKQNRRKLVLLSCLVAVAILLYMTLGVRFDNQRYMLYALQTRGIKVIVMILVSVCIGAASMVFQTAIHNTIVTPCLLGMNSLYSLIHTCIVFLFGSGSLIARNANLAFGLDLILMGVIATFIYGYMFKKTNYNVLYVLLIGTVLSSFFSNIQVTMTRVMDPNEYDTLLASLVASFSNIRTEIVVMAFVMMAMVLFFSAQRAAVAGRYHPRQRASHQPRRRL